MSATRRRMRYRSRGRPPGALRAETPFSPPRRILGHGRPSPADSSHRAGQIPAQWTSAAWPSPQFATARAGTAMRGAGLHPVVLIPPRELSVDDRAVRQLALADATASHTARRAHQVEMAAHEPAGTLKV